MTPVVAGSTARRCFMPDLTHQPCPDCGSSDALTLYESGWSHCFACEKNRNHTNKPEARRIKQTRVPLIEDLTVQALTKRGLTEETCKKWGYKVGRHRDQPVQVAEYREADGDLIGQKVRAPGKEFYTTGRNFAECLYGRHLWRTGGKSVILTEGEIDAMTVSQLQDHKWPVVSVPQGAAGASKAVRANIEWLESFEKVVFMFDMDEPGKKAAAECALLLSPGKAFIATLPLKDPNDMLRAGRGSEVVKAFWDARPYRPDGIVNASELRATILDRSTFASVSYPWPELQALTHGLRDSEMVLICGGSGIGKSEVARQLAWHISKEKPDEKIGYIALEESTQRTALGFLGIHLKKKIHIDRDLVTDEELNTAITEVFDPGQFYLYDHFGSNETDNLLAKIRYMVVGLGCKTVVLDHISIVVSGLEIDDERKALDVFSTKMRTLLQELKFRLIGVIHLKRTDGKTFEEGGHISLNDIRGSGGPGQLANIVIGVERDQQDEAKKNYTHFRVVKNRHSGQTGSAGWVLYTEEGLLEPCMAPVDSDMLPEEPDGKEAAFA